MTVEPLVYMDSDSVIDVLKFNQHLATKEPHLKIQDFQYKKQHIEYCVKLLKAAEYKDITLLTSSLTIAEVWHIGQRPPSEEEKRIIMSVLTSGKVFTLVPDSYFVAIRARDLAWKYNIQLKGADAIQVASALEANCIEYVTNDKPILSNKDALKKLGLNAINGHFTSALPPSYTQPLLDTPEGEQDNEKREL
jgi:predicted nucleic acid-binding protein